MIHLNEVIKTMQTDFDRKISEMTFELNNKIAHLSSMYEQLIVLQHQKQQQQQVQQQQPQQPQQQLQQVQQVQQQVNAHPPQVSNVNQNGQQQVYQTQQQIINAGQQHTNMQQQGIPVSVYQGQHNMQNGNQNTTYQAPPTTVNNQSNPNNPHTIKPNGNSMMDSLHKACLSLKSPAGPQAAQPTQTSTNQTGQLSGMKRDLPDELKLPPSAS